MKKLEDKILKKVYIFESKRITSELFLKIALFIILGFLVFIFASVLIDILFEEKILDLFQIFREDFEVFRKYIFDVLSTIYQGTPKIILLFFLFFVISFGILVFLIIKNFNYLKNKLKSIIKFWLTGVKVF